jgi:hypothetical protein
MCQRIFTGILTLCFIILFSVKGITYDSDSVHPKINEEASKQSINLRMSLRNVGFGNSVDSIVAGKEIYKWLREGGIREDAPLRRANNHFHDPLDNSGLRGSWLGISSLLWAQDQALLGPAGGDWSWAKARALYYEALTGRYRNSREYSFADTFRSLGQVMHLLADASVPAHTRNDIHVFPYEAFGIEFGKRWQTYESWAKRNYDKLNYSGLRISPAILYNGSLTGIPISTLWDQDKYTGGNVNVAAGTNIGLAEYSNANFFSEDTIFKNYPHPTYEDTNYQVALRYPEMVDAEDGKFDNRVYIRKTQGEADARLAAFSYISYDVIKKGYYKFTPFVLDDKVYSDYSALLVPRAVGYSAGLLDYFFRGDIDVSACRLANDSGEDMSGRFTLYYDNKDDQRIWAWSEVADLPAKGYGPRISLKAPSTAKEASKYMLVFRGTMGNEKDAVAGKIVMVKPEITDYLLGTNILLNEYQYYYPGYSSHTKMEHFITYGGGSSPSDSGKTIIGISDFSDLFRFLSDGQSYDKKKEGLTHGILAALSYDNALFQKSTHANNETFRQTWTGGGDFYSCLVGNDRRDVLASFDTALVIGNELQSIVLEQRYGQDVFTSDAHHYRGWGCTTVEDLQSSGHSTQSAFDVMGHASECDIENVILIYTIQDMETASTSSLQCNSNPCPAAALSEKYIRTDTYYLWYKIGPLVQKVAIPAVLTDTSERTSYSDPQDHKISGQKIMEVNCRIDDTTMIYSYVILTSVDGNWVFSRRIVGTINISDKNFPAGYRQESAFDY